MLSCDAQGEMDRPDSLPSDVTPEPSLGGSKSTMPCQPFSPDVATASSCAPPFSQASCGIVCASEAVHRCSRKGSSSSSSRTSEEPQGLLDDSGVTAVVVTMDVAPQRDGGEDGDANARAEVAAEPSATTTTENRPPPQSTGPEAASSLPSLVGVPNQNGAKREGHEKLIQNAKAPDAAARTNQGPSHSPGGPPSGTGGGASVVIRADSKPPIRPRTCRDVCVAVSMATSLVACATCAVVSFTSSGPSALWQGTWFVVMGLFVAVMAGAWWCTSPLTPRIDLPCLENAV